MLTQFVQHRLTASLASSVVELTSGTQHIASRQTTGNIRATYDHQPNPDPDYNLPNITPSRSGVTRD